MSLKSLKIISWNINGIRAIQKKGFHKWVKKANPDILCLQEIKAYTNQLSDDLIKLDNYHSYFYSAQRKGYSGVVTYTKLKPLNVRNGIGNENFDIEGRVIESEYKDFILYNVYFPNGGRNFERLNYKLDFYDAFFFYLEKVRKRKKEIIICGDFNTAHKEIDLARPKENETVSGFLPVERQWIDNIINLGYVDIFREFHKEAGWYTYWDPITRARDRNIGWRIDYFFVSQEMKKFVIDAKIDMNIFGSDHCPIEIEVRF